MPDEQRASVLKLVVRLGVPPLIEERRRETPHEPLHRPGVFVFGSTGMAASAAVAAERARDVVASRTGDHARELAEPLETTAAPRST